VGRVLLSLSWVLITINLFSQTFLTKADTAFVRKEFTEAIDLYKNALKKTKSIDVPLVYFKIAEAYKMGNNLKEAAQYYLASYKQGYKQKELLFNYADVLLKLGNFSEAENFFLKYKELVPNDLSVDVRLASVKNNIGLTYDKPVHNIKNISELNSPFSEYGLAIFDDKIVFSSTRKEPKDAVYTLTGQGFSNFYATTYNKELKAWEKPSLLNIFSSQFNDGSFYYDKNSQTAYFMQCNGFEGKDKNCKIYYSKKRDAQGKWSKPAIFEIKSMDYNLGHPAMTSDGKTMFFVSDMPGGQGGADLWMTQVNAQGKWEKPTNLGQHINTSGNEMFPFVFEDKYLYFASDGHIGFGGLDIYYVKIENGTFGKPTLLMPPFNSHADDFGIIFFDKDNGMLSSNRPGGKGDDDIWAFYLKTITITASGSIYDNENKAFIEGASVILKGSDGSSETVLSNKNGVFTFTSCKKDVFYTVQSSKGGYLTSEEKKFNTSGIIYDAEINKSTGYDLDLTMIAITKDEIDIQNIYYDYNKADLRPESKLELDKLIKILKENPNVKIIINSHSDARGSHTYNLELSDRRAQSVVNYLVENGVPRKMLESKGWGATNLRIKNAKTEEEHQANRRTTFNIIEE